MHRLQKIFTAVIFVLISFSAEGYTNYFAGTLPDFDVSDYESNSFRFVSSDQLNGKLVFVSRSENSPSSKIYSYDLKSQNKTLIQTLPNEGLPIQSGYVTTSNKEFLVIDGNLIVTDGTSSGTQLIKKFGTAVCCFNGERFSKVDALAILNGSLYFSVAETALREDGRREAITSLTLWISDGTKDGTRPIFTVPSGQRFLKPFTNTAYRPDSTFFLTVNLGTELRLWEIDKTNSVKVLHSLSDSSRYIGDSRIISSKDGAFICVNQIDQGSGTFLKFSIEGQLTKITSSCQEMSLSIFNDNFYFENNQGVWVLPGDGTEPKALFEFQNDHLESRTNNECDVIADKHWRIINTEVGKTIESSLIAIDSPNSFENVSVLPGGSKIIRCLDTLLLIRSTTESGHFIFDTELQTLKPVMNLNFHTFTPQRSFKVASPNMRVITGSQPFLLHPVLIGSVIPSIKLILEE